MNDEIMSADDRRLVITKMREIGFRDATKGAHLLRCAVEEYHSGMYMTKELYPTLAKRYGTTAAAVERAMRYAVKDAAPYCPPELRRQWFGSLDPDEARVSEFLKAMIVYLEIGI